tara:strand:- start:704 stop:1306 length:603 start_codon:yes stop_codon:yes gene_type:complete
MTSGLNIEMLSKLFERVRSQLDIETGMNLDAIKDTGELSEPGMGGVWAFSQKINKSIVNEAKLFGVDSTNPYVSSILFSTFLNTYPDFTIVDIEEDLKPRAFIVGSEDNQLPFVGGSRQGELDGVSYNDIESVFGEPSSSILSGDNKVQVEWDIQFDNGVRSTIYDYKQYGVDPLDIDYWSVGGNSPESAAEVYKVMGLI